MNKIVLISGHARSGKDYIAKKLKNYIINEQHKTCLIVHYADALKDFLRINFNYKDIKDQHERKMLQTVGTDIGRKNYEDTWVDIVIALIKGVGCEYDYILIPDARFPNEIQKIENTFGKDKIKTIRVSRAGEKSDLTDKQKHHQSETALDNWKFDIIVYNSEDDDDTAIPVLYSDILQ